MDELIEAARAGESGHIDRLIEAVWPIAYRLSYAVLGERELAQDAAQEACVVVYRTIAMLRSTQAFRVWFSRIVVREATRLGRRRSRVAPGRIEPGEPSDAATPIDVWRALARLPANLRAVIVLRYFRDFNSSEIAEILGIPAPTVRFRLMVAKRQLRPLLDDAQASTKEVHSHAIGI